MKGWIVLIVAGAALALVSQPASAQSYWLRGRQRPAVVYVVPGPQVYPYAPYYYDPPGGYVYTTVPPYVYWQPYHFPSRPIPVGPRALYRPYYYYPYWYSYGY